MNGQTKRIRRAICAVLYPMTGTRSTGTVLAKAAVGQGTITLPKNSFGLPKPVSAAGKGELAHDRPLRVSADTVVDEAGVSVPVSSLLGGARQNLDVSTEVRWDPPLTGMVKTATVDGALTGAASSSGPGAIAELLAYEAFPTLQSAQDAFLARVGPGPSMVLAWTGSGGGEKKNRGSYHRPDVWKLYVIASHGGGVETRADQATDILDTAEALLIDRSGADGFVFSAPGTTITSRDYVRTTPTSVIYSMTFETRMGVKRTEHRSLAAGDWSDWDATRIDADTATPVPLPVVDDASYDM